MKASKGLQSPSTSMTDLLPEGDLQRGDLCLKVEIAGWDLEYLGGFFISHHFLKNCLVSVIGVSYICINTRYLAQGEKFTGAVLVHFVVNAWVR